MFLINLNVSSRVELKVSTLDFLDLARMTFKLGSINDCFKVLLSNPNQRAAFLIISKYFLTFSLNSGLGFLPSCISERTSRR